MRYEVTVPLIVVVDADEYGEHGRVVDAAIGPDFGGFFSEAEEALGVWLSAEERWVRSDPDPNPIAWVAWDYVRQAIKEGSCPGTGST